MEVPWSVSNVTLDAVQALLVALPGAGLPLALQRFAGRWWALIPPVSIIAVVYGITALPGLADGLTWLALIACPPLAAATLAWAMHGGRPAYALAVLPLAAAAWIWSTELGGHLAAVVLTALSCVTLARLLRGVAPALALKLGIVAMAVSDTILILAEELQAPATTLNTAAPPAELPRLQVAIVDPSSLGFGDLFLAAVLGAILAVEATRRQQVAMALVLFGFAVGFDALFLVLDTLPGTVPVALALGVWELVRLRGARARDASAAPRAAPG
jgi:hypothetical protein